jgi:hypothetical protein
MKFTYNLEWGVGFFKKVGVLAGFLLFIAKIMTKQAEKLCKIFK